MLTRIYTPYGIPNAALKPRPDAHGATEEGAQEQAARQDALRTPKPQPGVSSPQPLQPAEPGTGGFNAGQGASRGLASVQESGNSRINIGSILTDFQSTMDALGADEGTREEVTAYLSGVVRQARKDKPEVPFIKQSLRTAANSLDQFITDALGNPSQVVREWVDALLMQPIEFHQADTAIAGGAAPLSEGTSASASAQNPESGLSRQDKARIKGWMGEAQQASDAGNHKQAQQLLAQALEVAEASQQPAVEGRVLLQYGRSLEAKGKRADAQTLYQSAAEKFAEAHQPKQQAKSLIALGQSLEVKKDALPQVEACYQEAISLLDGEPTIQSGILNDLGSVQLRQGQADAAITSFQAAYQALPEKTPDAQADLFSNLGAAYRQDRQPAQALKSYKLSLGAARQAKSKPAYRHALQQMASLYVELDQPTQARRALERLEQL